MEVHFTPELQAKVADLAAREGRGTHELLEDALTRYIEDESRFLQGVEEVIAAGERAEFIEEEEMDARVKRILES